MGTPELQGIKKSQVFVTREVMQIVFGPLD